MFFFLSSEFWYVNLLVPAWGYWALILQKCYEKKGLLFNLLVRAGGYWAIIVWAICLLQVTLLFSSYDRPWTSARPISFLRCLSSFLLPQVPTSPPPFCCPAWLLMRNGTARAAIWSASARRRRRRVADGQNTRIPHTRYARTRLPHTPVSCSPVPPPSVGSVISPGGESD